VTFTACGTLALVQSANAGVARKPTPIAMNGKVAEMRVSDSGEASAVCESHPTT
jgi:hypothetical protein